MKNRSLFTILLTLFLLTFIGVNPVLAEEFTVVTSSEVLTLDPIMYSETPTLSANYNIFEALTKLDHELDLQPGLAKSWETEDDTTWVFHLREGVKFHEGQEFTAEDVKFSLERAQNHPESQFKSDVAEIDSVEVRDRYTVEINTEYPFPTLPRKLKAIYMYSKDYVEEHDDQHLSTNPNGTGPYVLKNWDRDNKMELEAFEDYWRGKADLEKVVLKPITNAATRVASLLSDEADVVIDLPVQDVDEVKEAEDVEFVGNPGLRLIFLGMNTEEGPLSHKKVRKAIYHAINEDEIVTQVMDGHAHPAGQFFPEKVFGYNPDVERVEYDPQKAQELLAEAGYPDGFEIDLDAPNNRYMNDGDIAQAVVIQLARVGIDVNLETQPKSSYFDKVLSRDTDFYLLGWLNSNGDGSGTLEGLLHTPDDKYGRFNLGNYSNEKVDQLTEEAARTIDEEKRLELMQEAVKLAMDDVAQIPLHYQEELYGKQEEVNWDPRPDKYLDLYSIEKN